MEGHRHTHTFTFQNHEIRTVKKNASICFVKVDFRQSIRAYPKEYTKAIQNIDRTHEVYFDYPAKTTSGGL